MKMRKDSKIALAIFLVLLAATIITPIQIEKARIAKLKEQLPKLRAELNKHLPEGYELNRKISDEDNAAIDFEQATLYLDILYEYDSYKDVNLTTDHSIFIGSTKTKLQGLPALHDGVTFSELADRHLFDDPKDKFTDKDKVLALSYFKHTTELLSILDGAKTKPDCAYHVDLHNMSLLSCLRALARYLEFRACIMNKSNPENSAKSLMHILNIGNSMQKIPTLIATLVRIAIYGIANRAYVALPNKELLTKNSLERLITSIDHEIISLTKNQEFAFASEAAGFGPYIDSVTEKEFTSMGDFYGLSYSTYQKYKLDNNAWSLQCALAICKNIKTSNPKKHNKPAILKGMPTLPELPDGVKKMLSDVAASYESTYTKLFQVIAELYTTRAAIQIELFKREHGRLPKDSTEIKDWPEDPFLKTGGLKYLITKEGFKVYSVGEDGKDDGGAFKERTDFGIEIEVKK